MTVRSVGVEEELLLVEPGTGQPLAVAETALRTVDADGGRREGTDGDAGESLEFELQRQQLETSTKPCFELSELGEELRRGRSLAAEVAGRAGARVAALATSPVPVEPQLVRKGRYLQMAHAFGLTAYEQLTCGCHVHVSISSPDEGVAVLDRIRPWLPVLLALSANSPFWQGRDSAYASFRYQAWSRWPSAGPTDAFGSPEVYRQTVQQMVSTGTLLDTGMVYFDARLSEHYPTVEIRVSDVCLYADDAALIAALARALVETEARRWRAGSAIPAHRIEMLRLAAWRASRSGLDDCLLNPHTGLPEPALTVANALLEHVRDALDEAGDAEAVTELLGAVLARGNGAAFQRSACRDGSLASVIENAAAVTAN
ncbi:MAG: glutamate---cysteine ligase / carboxylate-amine ligase [Trebonia sp.]|jgi:carboxylate-amine ligase|nr:glutamate---cysteine ligase / carboxylate-amine ligase [Trebonia sp.]